MRRCQRCILPETYPRIDFDDHGVCEFCRDHDQRSQDGDPLAGKAEALAELVAYAKGLSGPYDTLVPFSGGKDSAYVLYYAKEVLGLRPIALNFDNFFQSDHAKINLEKIPAKLGVELQVVRYDDELMRRLYRCFLESVGELCSVCNAMGYLSIVSFAFREFKRLGYFPLVIGGWSKTFEEMPRVYSFDIKYFVSVIEKAGLLEEVLASPMVEAEAYAFLSSIDDPRQTTAVKTFFQLPDYIPWDTPTITKTLQEELGWEIPSAGFDTHFDCTAYHLAKYLEYRKYGFDQKVITLSAMIRHGQVGRSEALAMHEAQSFHDEQEVQETLKTLGVEEDAIPRDGAWHTSS